jgi:bifunctional DNA-binding transcriptional regulator/antitoxin component of YhaV-PrlF toxin-antitoxin module
MIELQEDGDDLILPIPEDILKEMDWKEGDPLEWIDNGDGTFTVRTVRKP